MSESEVKRQGWESGYTGFASSENPYREDEWQHFTWRKAHFEGMCAAMDEGALPPMDTPLGKNWGREVSEFRLLVKENDLVFVHAPANSMAAKHNGQSGYVTGFGDGWVFTNIDGVGYRFRPDELKML